MKRCYRIYEVHETSRISRGVFWLTDKQATFFSMKDYELNELTSDRELNMFSRYKERVIDLN